MIYPYQKYIRVGLCALMIWMLQTVSAQQTYVYTQAQTQNGILELKLDLYLAARTCKGSRPTLVFVHPGGFRAGNRKDILARQFLSSFRPFGFNVVSIDYRLIHHDPVLSMAYANVAQQFAGEGLINEQLNAAAAAFEDTVAALNYLTKNASAFCIDPGKIVLAGASAGAIVVLNVAYSLDDFGVDIPPLAGLINLWGGFMPDQAMGPSDTPILIVHGKKDRIIPHTQAERLWDQAIETQTPVQMYSFADDRHGVQITRRVKRRRLLEYIRQFALDIVNGRPIPTFRFDG